jgi:hypothetical protein
MMPIASEVDPVGDINTAKAKEEAKSGDGVWTTIDASPEHSIACLIREAEHYRQVWHIEGLWQPNAIMAVHSLEGEFKSIFAYQTAEALATAQPLLRKWNAPAAVRVGVLQTEMPDNMVGDRLKAMYPDRRIPRNLIVSNEGLTTRIRQCFSAPDKFQVIHNWLIAEDIGVLVWDTINSVLAAYGNPNSEEAAAQFYNQLQLLPLKGALVVRHDSKPSKDTELRRSNQKIRGSNLHAEIASTIISLERPDKRSNKVVFDIGKLRHDAVPEPMECWFDAGSMRLTLLPPAVALLEGDPMTREALNHDLLIRFGLKERTADELTRHLEEDGFLLRENRGHERVWALNPATVAKPDTPAAIWLPLVNFQPTDKIAEPSIHPQEICDLAEVGT